ncbi:probably inactive leucine-rich repeat receptor-like protein kinase At5g48380 [Ziziphus jujuba]|uniref:Probably inactive leucine-rich repeat receptor-like protein kinase At5g48380 n=1 Tax=Ziziphus jujuba TaxID=326968 RepID=A0A6P3Z4R8_ZIZJJ|nr:probably inactive leucine-rich repeat receptor-like protein kinase At5g48380 [Ziziphus jujuba]
MSNGNLYDWLHHPAQGHEVMIMEWPLRVKIAVGIARGLAWLHHNCNLKTVHLNLNSNCILLDQNFEPKISNLMDPNHPNSSRIKRAISGDEIQEMDGLEKEDVYRFGIVLLELITLKEPSPMTLVEWVGQLLSSASAGFYHGIDGSLVGKGFNCEIIRFLRVVAECVQPFPDERPTMLQVQQKLIVVGDRYGLT